MLLSKSGILAALLSNLALAATGAEPVKPLAALDVALVDKRIQEILPTAKEKHFEEIGWASGIRDAERLAKEHGRPVFLFSNVGQMDLGRC